MVIVSSWVARHSLARGERAGIGVDPRLRFGELPRASPIAQDMLRLVTGELTSRVDLYWLPLGTGGHSVRHNGRLFEARWAGRLRLFRYELRCWRDGVIPDIAEAVDSPRCVTEDEGLARRLVALAPTVPRAVWGRDELRTGEMWNSNSVISWLFESAGVPTGSLVPPERGRATG